MGYYRIARFANRGRGLQAVCVLPQGTEIIRTPCLVVPQDEIRGVLAHYVFKWQDSQVAVAFGDASLVNHARPANCDYYPDRLDKSIVVTANRAIFEGEELTIDYGWTEPGFVKIGLGAMPLEPDSETHRCWLQAESHREAGQLAEAAGIYARRAEMGDDEEAWYARVQQARCLRDLGHEGGFLAQALAAFNRRPDRAEPLYDLARFYRERGMHEASVLFSEPGLALRRPEKDALFVEDFVYGAGLQEEYSIAANYSRDPARKDRGHAACNWLALNRDVPAGTRDLARANLFFYIEPASAILPSFTARPVGFTAPEGYRPTNPSVACRYGQILLCQRSVNLTLTEDGRYVTDDGAAERSRNFLLRLNEAMEIEAAAEILPPIDLPEPAFPLVLGLHDLRLFAWRGELWCCGTVRELSPEGYNEEILARIDDSGPGPYRLIDWRVLRPEGPRRHEKNWMPQVKPAPAEVGGDRLEFLYSCDPTRVVDEHARTIAETVPAIAAEEFRGGSQVIDFDACPGQGTGGGSLALIHEVEIRDEKRHYYHRFVWFDQACVLRYISRRFFFQHKGIEFAAGLAWHPDGKLVSYGVSDCESWAAALDAGDERRVLEAVERLPSAATDNGQITRSRHPCFHSTKRYKC